MWSSVALPAIIAASVTILVNAGIERTWQLIVRAWNAPRADNQTLSSGGYLRDDGGRTVYMCVVRCAPSRRFRRPRLIDHLAVGELVRALVPDMPAEPERFDKDGVRFQAPDSSEFGSAKFVNVQTNGLVEFGAPLSEMPLADGVALSLDQVAERIVDVVTQVQHGQYQRIFRTRRRLDWAVSVGGYVRVEPANQPQPWAGLMVGGELAGSRATNAGPARPIRSQFGEDALRNSWHRTRPDQIIRAALTDWLQRSGYWRPDLSVDQVIARVTRQRG